VRWPESEGGGLSETGGRVVRRIRVRDDVAGHVADSGGVARCVNA
jgi:hypothetical protein